METSKEANNERRILEMGRRTQRRRVLVRSKLENTIVDSLGLLKACRCEIAPELVDNSEAGFLLNGQMMFL